GRGGLGSIFVWASGNGGKHNDNCNCDGYTNSIYTISVSSASQAGVVPWYLEQCSSTLATTYSSGSSHLEKNIVTVDVDFSYFTELESGQKPNTAKLCTKSHTGTSASAPIAAAICALALEANPLLTWRDMQYLIVLTSRYKPLERNSGWITNGLGRQVSTTFGYGLMDAAAMVNLAKEWKTLPKQHICTTPTDNTERLIPSGKDEKMETSMNTTGCKNTENAALNLMFCYLDLKIKLKDLLITGLLCLFIFWGENPQGNWKLAIINEGSINKDGPGKFISWYLVFYGTETRPFSLKHLKEKQIFQREKEQAFTARGVNNIPDSINHCATRRQFHISINGENICTYTCPLGHYGDVTDFACHMCDNHVQMGFSPDAERNQCFPCLPTCSECESNKVCSACKAEFFLYDQKCVPICPKGTYAYKKICKGCHSSCETCFGPLSSNCLTCTTSHVLHNNSCFSECPSNYFFNDDNICIRCHRSCEDCASSFACTTCHSDWVRNSEDSWYNEHLDICQDCYYRCDHCSGPNTQDCVYCESGYVWHNGNCIEACPRGYFTSQDECVPCDIQCAECKNNENCLLCKDGFILHSGKCYQICPMGYYDNEKHECKICHTECQHCFGPSNSDCSSCHEGYQLVENTCQPYCPDDYGPTYCSSCYDNSSFSNNVCIPCLDDEYFNKDNKQCERCHDNCGRCFGPEDINCLSCSGLLRLDEVKHICLPCCNGALLKKSECCTCSRDLDVCINSDHPRSIAVTSSSQDFSEVIVPLKHIIPIVIGVCFLAVLVFVFIFGLLQGYSVGLCELKCAEQKYERVPSNIAAKFDAEMEKISLTCDDLEDEDDTYEKV
ncbi:furin-like protease 2, partial [Caerostris extrusa]